MSEPGYIYVRGWDRFQHYKNRRPSWIKLHLSLMGNDDWLELSPSDRVLLLSIWMAVAEYGQGRVRADPGHLRARAKTPKGNLVSLINAGFIEVRASKALADFDKPASPEVEREEEVEKEPLEISRNRNGRAQGTVSENGQRPTLPAALARILDAKITTSLTDEQITLAGRAWNEGTQLRHSLADVEAADNPTAMFISVCKRIAPGSQAQHDAAAVAKRKGAVHRCRYLWHQGLEEGDQPNALRDHLEQEYRHDPSIVQEAIGAT